MRVTKTAAGVAAVVALAAAAFVAVMLTRGGDTATEGGGFALRTGVVTSFTGDLSPFGRPIDEAARIAATWPLAAGMSALEVRPVMSRE